jgi:hypothetical protein
MGEQAEALELGELVADGRRRDAQPGPLDEILRPNRLAGRDVLLDDADQDLPLPLAEVWAWLGHRVLHPKMLRQEVGRDAAAEKAAARSEHERFVAARAFPGGEAEPFESLECGAVERVAEPD